MAISLDTALGRLAGIGPQFLRRLERLHLYTVRDVLWHFPSRYEDISDIIHIADLAPGQHATVQGTIETVSVRRSWQRHIDITEVHLNDETGSIRAVWFHQPYLKNVLREGVQVNIAGKVSQSSGELYFGHPTYEILHGDHMQTRHTARIVPIYPETKGFTSKGLRFVIKPILDSLKNLDDWLPPDILQRENLPPILEALRAIHFPNHIEDVTQARARFAFEDLLLLQLGSMQRKSKLAKAKAVPIPADVLAVKAMLKTLPFPLTESQKTSLWEIMQDMARSYPMNRLLQGDVGSGKTVVALIAAWLASRQGVQAAFMAPTEVLARQHFETARRLFGLARERTIPPVALLTGHDSQIFFEAGVESRVKKPAVLSHIQNGTVSVIVGTHALIEKTVSFRQLGLIIVDEQHRFGVRQRAQLASAHHPTNHVPHFLSMSATPIPRTLALSLFGDLDVSAITQLPSGRKVVITKIVSGSERQKTYEFMRSEIASGRQAFVICPRIEESVADPSNAPWLLDAASVRKEHKRVSAIFPEYTVSMLHGQMKPKEKEAVMNKLRDGSIDILVSTSVIEVGVDIPNASVMTIENADRFGLAQLYQFRGRVGRGSHQSYCFLFAQSDSIATKKRLHAMIAAKNGFELAEYDLQIRGPGQFIGEKQTGLPDSAMRNLGNRELVLRTHRLAAQLIEQDQSLSTYPLLRQRLAAFTKETHGE